ncbi:MAG: hypothetical protein U0P45_13940 [Acidimicrobiales bacterium]
MTATTPPRATKQRRPASGRAPQEDPPMDDAEADRPRPRRAPAPGRAPGPVGTSSAPSAARGTRLPWTLAAVGLLGTLAFGLAWASARDGAQATSTGTASSAAMLRAAKGFSKDLTNFDGATIDRDFDRITAHATGEFRRQADQFFSTKVRTQLKEAQASSRGEVRSAFVQTMDGDRGTVFVVVDQTIANNRSPQPQADTLRMELSLVRGGSSWKVERVSVLTAPSGGATAPTSGATGSGG